MNLEFDLYAKDNASKAIDDVGTSAKTSAARLADMGKAAQSSADDVSKAGAKLKRSADETAKGFDRAHEAADGTEEKFEGLGYTMSGTIDIFAGFGEAAKGNVTQGLIQMAMGGADLAQGFKKAVLPAIQAATIGNIKNAASTVTSTAATVAHKGAMIASAVATKALTAGQWLLNAAMSANPLGLVIKGVMLLVAAVVIAYQKSETFRNIVDGAFSVVKQGALTLALVAVKAFHFLLNVWLTVAGGIVNGAANAFGWVPGLGPKLRGAADSFNGFKDSVNKTLSKVETDLQVQLDTGGAKKSADQLAQYVRTRNWTVYVSVARSNKLAAMGGGGGGYGGGRLTRPVNAMPGFPWGHYPSGGVHKALDFPVRTGTPVRAPMSGVVMRDGWDPTGFGIHIRTHDADGNYTILGHLSREMVRPGQRISAGQLIAYSGNTGHSSGPHLHMERRRILYDPSTAFNFTPMLFDSGGILPPGISVVRNNTGRPEPLARADGTQVIKIYLDGRELKQSRARVERQDG